MAREAVEGEWGLRPSASRVGRALACARTKCFGFAFLTVRCALSASSVPHPPPSSTYTAAGGGASAAHRF